MRKKITESCVFYLSVKNMEVTMTSLVTELYAVYAYVLLFNERKVYISYEENILYVLECE